MRDEDPDNVDNWQISSAQFALVWLLGNKMLKLTELTYSFQKNQNKSSISTIGD